VLTSPGAKRNPRPPHTTNSRSPRTPSPAAAISDRTPPSSRPQQRDARSHRRRPGATPPKSTTPTAAPRTSARTSPGAGRRTRRLPAADVCRTERRYAFGNRKKYTATQPNGRRSSAPTRKSRIRRTQSGDKLTIPGDATSRIERRKAARVARRRPADAAGRRADRKFCWPPRGASCVSRDPCRRSLSTRRWPASPAAREKRKPETTQTAAVLPCARPALINVSVPQPAASRSIPSACQSLPT